MTQNPNFPASLKRLFKRGWYLLLMAASLPFLVFFFGFCAKRMDEYDCAMGILEQSPAVQREIGLPFKPGLFAWMPYFESAGAMRQGAFSTSISGPEGEGKVRVEFYRAPIGARLYIRLERGEGETDVYDGPYVCP
ncbi:MAG: hypothetical protein R6X31_15600 [Anaerolineae bacterium]